MKFRFLKRIKRAFYEIFNASIEKAIIANSKWWDSLWYIQTYNHNFSRKEALDYWYHKGWKKGESPSKYINVEVCGKWLNGINPVIAYLDKNIVFLPDSKNNFKDENDKERIEEYLTYRNTRKSKSVVYTCITNDYDDLRELSVYKYVHKDWDYICFTDNEEHIKQGKIGIWEIRPLQFEKLDGTRNNRYHKLNPHLVLPEYDESIYIDANINILSSFLFDFIRSNGSDIVLPKHSANQCIYNEYKNVLKYKLDKPELINSELEILKKAGMPKNYGMCECNIIYRKHYKPNIVKIDEEWWYMVSNFAKRDQLAFMYLLWKNGIKPQDMTFENSRLDVDNFYVFGHKKGK